MKKAVLLTSLSFMALLLSSCSGAHYSDKDYVSSLAYKDDFKILQLTDLHLGAQDDVEMHLRFVDLTIQDANPDMIVITGDLFTFASRETVRQTFDFFDSYQVPWTFTYGNHDDQGTYDLYYLGKTAKNYKHCVFNFLEDDVLSGRSNQVINLIKEDKIIYQIYNLDSHSYHFGDFNGYDMIQQDQIDWYARQVDNVNKQEYGEAYELGDERVPNVCFFHIPLFEFEQAYKDYQAGLCPGIGENREGYGNAPINNGMFDVMKKYRSTKGVFVGHDHSNNSVILYEGIYLGFGIKATDRVYYEKDMLGGRTITLHNDGSLETTAIYHTYEEME